MEIPLNSTWGKGGGLFYYNEKTLYSKIILFNSARFSQRGHKNNSVLLFATFGVFPKVANNLIKTPKDVDKTEL